MIHKGIMDVDLSKLSPSDEITLKKVDSNYIIKLYQHSKLMGCKLITLQYGKFYLKDERYRLRNETIDYILNN